ncbi:MAG: peptide deformylase [Brevinematales bacterium]|nr:peptide deformylase [Brevinematales bacterium]
MALLEMATYGDPVLRKKAEEVKKIDKEILEIIENMKETLMNQSGVGLAAPQVGISKRIFIVDLPQEKGTRRLILLNPKIIFYSKDKIVAEEGCLSFPGVWGNVERSNRVRVKGTLLSGKSTVIEGEGMFARVLQHEIDHLDGKLFIDYFSPEDKEKNKEKLEEILNKNREKFGKVEL